MNSLDKSMNASVFTSGTRMLLTSTMTALVVVSGLLAMRLIEIDGIDLPATAVALPFAISIMVLMREVYGHVVTDRSVYLSVYCALVVYALLVITFVLPTRNVHDPRLHTNAIALFQSLGTFTVAIFAGYLAITLVYRLWCAASRDGALPVWRFLVIPTLGQVAAATVGILGNFLGALPADQLLPLLVYRAGYALLFCALTSVPLCLLVGGLRSREYRKPVTDGK